jgi:hypothetical protein
LVKINGGHKARDQAAHQQVGDDCQQEGDDDRLTRVDELGDDELVDHIQQDREQEHLADILPAVLEHLRAMPGIVQQSPEIGRLAGLGVGPPGNEREDRGHHGLQQQAEVHWPADTAEHIVSKPHPEFFHGRQPLA